MFKVFNKSILGQLNALEAKVDKMNNARGDGFINVQRVGNGTALNLNIDAVRRRIAKQSQAAQNRVFQVRSIAEPLELVFEGEPEIKLSRVGIYSCIEMVVNNEVDPGNDVAGWDSPGSATLNEFPTRITDKQDEISKTFTPYDGDDYEQWLAGKAYSVDDIIEVITQYTDFQTSVLWGVSNIYKALKENIKRPPATNPDYWRKLSVEVLNIPEGPLAFGATREAKLAKFDLIVASATADNTGPLRWAGWDTVGATRLFYPTGGADGTWPICNVVYNAANAPPPTRPQAIEGELGYNIVLRNTYFGGSSAGRVIDWTSIDNIWVSATWFNNTWSLTPILAFSVGKGVIIDDNDLAVDIDSTRGSQGLDYIGTRDTLTVKVDGITIGFNASGELEVI